MRKLSEQEFEKIVNLIKEGKPLPDDYKTVLFDTKKEYELMYADKEREEDILADTMAVPLQKIKTFRNGENINDWTNMLIFGDNLQVLKTLLQMKQEGKLKNADGTPGVRLVYIDPPFATRQEFRGSQDQKAYQDKLIKTQFIDFLRKRLVFLREILSVNGSIYIHLDERSCHYVKIIADEVFGKENFRREIIWNTSPLNVAGFKSVAKNWIYASGNILYYKKNESPIFNEARYEIPDFIKHFFKFEGKDESGAYRMSRYGEKIYIDEEKGDAITNVWNDIMSFNYVTIAASESFGYPTQKPEKLLERIINISSDKGDLVLDCFAGSGTTLAVAEKLGRRWIGIDCGKLAIYTMQKRLLNISDSKDLENSNKKYGAPCKSFELYNAGLYDYKIIKDLPWEHYRDFALKLFQCRDEKHEISKIELDGYLGADNVLVFNYQKHKDALLERDFIDDLHRYLREKIGRRFFIIAPAASVRFLEDYIEKDKTKYFILRIPYSIIEEIHDNSFTKIKQPVSEMDVNDTIDSVGFDFIQVPVVECKYYLDKPKNADLYDQKTKECVIKIEKFESKVISRKPLDFANLETLSMVMLDYDFNGEVFDLDQVFYAEELKKNDYEVRFAEDKVKDQIMVIYIDIFGNEKREIKTLADFKEEK